MSDIIRLLPDSVANQIAAGEVIQRPSSVVKELVENSIDAGATKIEIIIKDAGRTLIQVIDNGSGMSPTDARMAFERHATSKISKADDLFSLHTMGFRGEALASIAAVAHIDLRTMKQDANVGTRIIINGSKVESQEPEVCPVGANMMVKNIFFNVPARRKFLKKDSVELANIMREFERLALVNPGVEFTIINNDNLLHQLLPGSFKQRIVDLFGSGLERQLVPVETNTSIVSISGFVGLPQFARKRNALQYLFVNGRNMRHPYFHKAIIQCYQNLLPPDEQPNYFLNFTVEPESIDVNIHPTKNEIKFEDEPAIWQIITAAVKEALGRYNGMPGIDFSDDTPEIPFFNPDSQAPHDIKLDPLYNPFADDVSSRDTRSTVNRSKSVNYIKNPLAAAGKDWNNLYEQFKSEVKGAQPPSTADTFDFIDESQGSGLNSQDLFDVGTPDSEISIFDTTDTIGLKCFSLKGRYIVTPVKSGIMFVDQHRAHVRILFDRYLDMISCGSIVSQRIMFPEIVRLTPAENIVLENISDNISKVGFDLSYLGDNTWSINGYPSIISETNPVDVLMKIIDDETEGGDKPLDTLNRRIALSMAKTTSVKTGVVLTDDEMEHILAELFSKPSSKYTPDGLLIISILPTEDISRMFV